jgi:hypothetical protein
MWKGTKNWEIWLFTYQNVVFRDFIFWSLSHQIDQGKGLSESTNLIDDPDNDQKERYVADLSVQESGVRKCKTRD